MNTKQATMQPSRTAAIVGVLLWSFCSWGGGGEVWAQSDEDKAAARSLLADGDRLIERGDRQQRRRRTRRARISYERALERYRRAYELIPKPTIFYAIAGAEEKLGRHLDAVEHYQRVLDEVEDGGLRRDAAERIEALSQHVAVAILTITPAGAEISIDGRLEGQAPLGRPIYLAPGEHVVTVTATGYSPYEGTLTVSAGTREERAIELVEVPVVVKRPKPVEEVVEVVPEIAPPPPPRPRPPSKLPVFLGTSLTLAFAVGATATGFLAYTDYSDLHDEIPRTREQLEDISRRGKTLALVTDGLMAGAVIAGAYTLYRYLFVYRPERATYLEERAAYDERRGQATRKLWFVPYAGAGAGGVAVGGRF